MSGLFDISTWSVFQWILVVLAAGFIGQFGKSFAQFLMAKIKAGRSRGRQVEKPAGPPPAIETNRENARDGGNILPAVVAGGGLTAGDEVAAAPRKADLAEIPPAPEAEKKTSLPDATHAAGGVDKKILKAQLKLQKKAAKAAKKES